MSIPTLRLRQFNPSVLEKRRLLGSPPTIVVIGKRGSGKSTLMQDILYHLCDIPAFVCMSPTEEGNSFYKEYVHPLLVHNDYKPEVTSNVLKQQKAKVKKLRDSGIDPNTRPDIGIGLLLDDCGYDKGIFREKDIREIFMNGRHFKICFIASLQYVVAMPPDLRTNVDYVFCLRENSQGNQKRLFQYFFGCFDRFDSFREVLNECTNDFGCLVLDNTSRSTKIEDCVFYYKAVQGRKFKIGSKELWCHLNEKQIEQGNNESDEDDYYHSTKNKRAVIVKKEK